MKKQTLFWVIDEICQLACRYCFYQTGNLKRHHKFIDFDKYEDKIVDLAQFFKKITLTGGEAMLHPRFWDIISSVKEAGSEVSYITNGANLNREILNKSLDYGVKNISISLDSLNPAINELLRPPRNNGGAYTHKLLEDLSLFALEKNRPGLTLLQTITKQNLGETIPMAEYAQQHGINLMSHPVDSTNIPSELSLNDLTKSQVNTLEKSLLFAAGESEGHKDNVEIVMNFIREYQQPTLACPMGKEAYVLDIGGNLNPCFYRTELSYGNIFENPLGELMAIERNDEIEQAKCASLACAGLLNIDRTKQQ